VIVNLKIGRIALADARNAGDLRALRAAVERAVAEHAARAAEPRGVDAAALARVGRAAAAEVESRCS
jgi:hypothetical protein